MSDQVRESGAFFGRRKGKTLRFGQAERLETLLPRLRVDPVDPLRGLDGFADLWLEIGFGGGEHLAAQARAHPEIGFIGVEPSVNDVAKCLGVFAEEGLGNDRVWDDDVLRLLPHLPAGSVGRVYLLYPDPWPKRRQRKRRLLNDESLAELARILRPGGELRFATDNDDYAGWALVRAMASPDFTWTAARAEDWRHPWPGWPGTRYEAKARREGRGSAYLTFRRS